MKFLSSLISIVLIPLLITGQLPAQNTAVAPTPAQALHIRVISGNRGDALAGSKAPNGFTFEVTDANGAPVTDAAVSLRLPDSGATGVFADGTHSSVAYTNQNGQAQINGIQWGETTGSASIRVTATKDTAHAGLLLEQSIAPTVAKTAALPSIKLAEPASPTPISKPSVPAQPEVKQPGAITMPSTNSPIPPKVEIQSNIDPVKPIASAVTTGAAPALAEPSVSVTSATGADQVHSSKKKWLILAAVVVAGGAAGALMMGKGKSSGSSSSTTGLTIGSPTVSIGH